MTAAAGRTVQLRRERAGDDWRNLWAYVDEAGNLHIDGQDLGPATAIVSPDGEYEWSHIVEAHHVPNLLDLLGLDAAGDLLDQLERRYSGTASYELERVLREGGVPVQTAVY